MTIILITGVGGPLGQALVKAARLSALPTRIVGTDRHALSAGLDWVDRPHVISDAAEPEAYLADIGRVCSEEHVSLILPGSDSELALLSSAAESLHATTEATVVCSPPRVLRVGQDKCETCAFLEQSGRNFPASARLNNASAVESLIAEFGFPLIAKPCRGSGSRGLFKVRGNEDVEYLRTIGSDMVLQEYLSPDEEEYTVAIYTQRDGAQAGSICFKRELVAGNTYRAWVDKNPAVLAEAEAVVRALRPAGPCNVQLRLTTRGAVTFEINARFSGTTAMRAHFGFNEVEMAIRDFALGSAVPRPEIRAGIALRFWEEIYLDADGRREAKPQALRKPLLRSLRADDEEWNSVLHRVTQHDVYFLPAYHRLAEERGEGEARLFVYERDQYTIALPLILRRVAEVQELDGTAGEWRDATSVYGYGGPLASHEHLPTRVVQEFQNELTEAMRELQVVDVFSRLHPLIPQRSLLAGLGSCQPGGQTVSIDLAASSEAQRAQYRGAAKNRINRLLREGATCEVDPGKCHLADFVSIYHETMRRVGAQHAYFFDDNYFSRLAANLGPVLQLFVVKLGAGEIIAGGLFTLCDRIVQYHLGGTRDHALQSSPTGLLFETVRLWANERGARVFHLGGGVGSTADSLFQFKAGFSNGRHEFATWRWIIAPDAYSALAEERRRWDEAHQVERVSADFFPTYRCDSAPMNPLRVSRGPGIETQTTASATSNG